MRATGFATIVVAAALVTGLEPVSKPSVVSGASRTGAVLTNGVPAKPDDKALTHVLNRIGFGPAPGDVAEVRRIGLAKYIEQQLQPERIDDAAMTARLAGFETLKKSARELAEAYFIPAQMERRRAQQQAAQDPSMSPDGADKRAMRTPEQIEAMRGERQVLTELTQQKVLRAAYSERQLEEVMVDFWFNHFNVFAGKGQTRLYLSEYEREAIRPRVFGKFRDLLGATAESPAMLFYLDNWQSSAPEGSVTAAPDGPSNRPGMRPGRLGRPGRPGRPGRMPPIARPRAPAAPGQPAPNRRPRGVNENYARELMELHTLGVDGGYTQKDVQEIARAFTGWTIANPRQGGGFHFEPRMHDDGEKMVLGHRIKAGGGRKDGELVLDILAAHPSTARFIATKLARRFVADAPPAALVDRAAARFRETGGNIREVVRTIVTSPEFFAPGAYRAKVKTPFEFVASAVRATSAEVRTSAASPPRERSEPAKRRARERVGESEGRSPSDQIDAQLLVQTLRTLGMPPYGCQPPTGYADRADAWVNTGALLNRMNFAVSLTGGRMHGVRTSPAENLETARDTLVDQVLAGDLSAATRSTVARATQAPQAIALLVGSPEFQRR
jgi:uncharacterized protein (DUF1800 family)